MKKVGFATGSRADYGIVRRYLSMLNDEADIELGILATGALLDREYGHVLDYIYGDHLNIDCEINIQINTESNYSILKSMSIALSEFGAYFDQINYDLLIMLGDRYEMLSVAIAAAMYNIPILHIHGGEATYGNYDEFIRHSITKMSRFHFTASEEYRERVIQLGENPEYVFNMGALGAENCLTIDKSKVERTVRQLSICRYFVVLFHPETLTSNSAECQICNLLKAIERFPQYFFVFIGSNADTHSEVIRKHIQFFIGRHDNAIYYENLNSDSYHYLLQQSLGLIGNSSSGIIEAPSLGIYTVNIGERQRGRIRGNSVLDVVCSCEEIAWAIETVINKKRPLKVCNPYYKKGALENYLRKTKEILNKVEDIRKKPKEFYDLAMKN